MLAFLGSWFLRKRDYDLKLWEKIIDRRIDAHESLISIALEMRVMIALGGIDSNGEVRRAPNVLQSKEAFEARFSHVSSSTAVGSTWLSVGAVSYTHLTLPTILRV